MQASDGREALISRIRAQSAVNDPFLGATTTVDFERDSALFPGERWSSVAFVSRTVDGAHEFEEYVFTAADGARDPLPVGFMFERLDDGSSAARVYSDHHLVDDRAAILEPVEGIHPWRSEDDVLFAYFQALNGNRLEDVLGIFQQDGYFRHSNGVAYTGRDELKADFSKMMGEDGIRIRYCRFTDDGTTCAVECYMPSGRPAVAVYERGEPGKLRAVRIYL